VDEMKRKNTSKLDEAAQRTAEIIIEHMSTLPLEKAKAMREEIRRLAAKPSRLAARGKASGSPSH
jgi:flagellin-specific chaperone FliS